MIINHISEVPTLLKQPISLSVMMHRKIRENSVVQDPAKRRSKILKRIFRLVSFILSGGRKGGPGLSQSTIPLGTYSTRI